MSAIDKDSEKPTKRVEMIDGFEDPFENYGPPFPNLSDLFGVFLNEEWSEEYKTIDNAVNQFVLDGDDKGFVKDTILEFNKLLSDKKSDEDLKKIIREMGCAVRINGSVRTWLEDLRANLISAAGK